ncbi:uncharacterized protein BX664DRAFT_326713 [Halteromyces radiatus]|uniref:uncharacterized protein n=1 Tax=Halteromyces radiatus TaxID=101107 RepID=UPI00221F178D|nr:uncharacterized protein BX664DRAFT_326713 [Halteromyces radiatus]KAI8097572.1 hypothetical protein BX664DRAFT_326713 [Halteromyces radiatus]
MSSSHKPLYSTSNDNSGEIKLKQIELTENTHGDPSLLPSPCSSQATTSQQPNNNEVTTERRCWICFGEDKDSDGKWVKPCPCSLVAHEQCLLDWIAENQKGRSPMKKVLCPQCSMPYYLFEHRSISLACLESIQSVARAAAPYLMVFGLGCSILVAASTYGAYTVLTLFGRKEGERLLGPTNSWTWRTFLALPTIPFALIASRSRLADGILPVAALVLLRASAPVVVSWPPSPALVVGSLPWIRLVYFTFYSMVRHHLSQKLSIQPPTSRTRSRYTRFSLYHYTNQEIMDQRDQSSSTTTNNLPPNRDSQDADLLYGRSHRDLNVTIMGALLWPTISGFIGNGLKQIKYIRYYFPEAFHRNLLGGCLFVVAKDMAILLYRYKRILQRRSRRIRPFDEPSSPNE